MSEQKDRPDREKKIKDSVKSELLVFSLAFLAATKNHITEEEMLLYLISSVDQILALIPDIEEAKKQGEERIIKWVEDTDILTMLSPAMRKRWQALKEEK